MMRFKILDTWQDDMLGLDSANYLRINDLYIYIYKVNKQKINNKYTIITRLVMRFTSFYYLNKIEFIFLF